MATYNIRLSISENDSYDSTLRFDSEQLTDAQKQSVNTAIADMTSAMDTIRDIVV